MKNKIAESVAIPDGITCTVNGMTLTCSKGSASVTKIFSMPGARIESKGNTLHLTCEKGNKKMRAAVLSGIAHAKNLFAGLNEPFVYEMEICNVHFPMTVKVEGNKFVVTNFLGEKQKRVAAIVSGVSVDVKGTKVIVSSTNLEAAGQTAANIEKATNITKRDRRVFQDGIFITSKCGRPI